MSRADVANRERWLLVLAALVVVAVLVFSLGRSSGPWMWTATGTLAQHPHCSSEGHAQVPDTCVFQVANPPTLSRKVTLDVRVHNLASHRVCYGLSVTTSYLAGLQSFCVRAHARGGYAVTNQARFFVDFTLDLFESSGARTKPLAATPGTSPSPFVVTFRQAKS